MNSKTDLSEKDRKFREFALNGNMWLVILQIGTPLALYQSLTQLFKIFDTMMASHISATSVSAVSYLSQLNIMLSALGGGLAIGASIQISAAYGSGDFELVKKRVSTLFAMCGILGIGILAILVPFTPQFLRLVKTPEEFISSGTTYFILELIGMVISFFNNVYIAIERVGKFQTDSAVKLYGSWCQTFSDCLICLWHGRWHQSDRSGFHPVPAADAAGCHKKPARKR
ncbi:MAG: MATE family efflux transporter [Hungatella sp.]